MADLNHAFGADIGVGMTGDLGIVSGAELGRQRVLRRLLTNPGDYIWQPGYGAGLGRFVGQPASAARIRAVVRGQIFKEAAVARDPEPVVDVEVHTDGVTVVRLRYADATTGASQVLTFNVGEG
jgi:phage baseplate assembly protein W